LDRLAGQQIVVFGPEVDRLDRLDERPNSTAYKLTDATLLTPVLVYDRLRELTEGFTFLEAPLQFALKISKAGRLFLAGKRDTEPRNYPIVFGLGLPIASARP
jgi:hypothetical protein